MFSGVLLTLLDTCHIWSRIITELQCANTCMKWRLCVCVRTWVCMSVCVCVCVCVCCVCVCVCVCVHVCVCDTHRDSMHACMCVCVCMRMSVCACAPAHAHDVCTCLHMYTCVHVYMSKTEREGFCGRAHLSLLLRTYFSFFYLQINLSHFRPLGPFPFFAFQTFALRSVEVLKLWLVHCF